jgi:hypothetical protein
MAEDYYGGNDGTTANESPESSSETPDTGGSSDKMGAETSLLPKSMFQGKDLAPGHVCKIRVVKDYGDEIEVQWAGDDATSSNEPEGDESASSAFDKRFSASEE